MKLGEVWKVEGTQGENAEEGDDGEK